MREEAKLQIQGTFSHDRRAKVTNSFQGTLSPMREERKLQFSH